MVGWQTLNLPVKVRLLLPELLGTEYSVLSDSGVVEWVATPGSDPGEVGSNPTPGALIRKWAQTL